jgi:hypothetical protein
VYEVQTTKKDVRTFVKRNVEKREIACMLLRLFVTVMSPGKLVRCWNCKHLKKAYEGEPEEGRARIVR